MSRILDRLKAWLLLRWWGRNLANIITIFRLAAVPVCLFASDWKVQHKILVYVILELTDLIDGPVARWLEVNNGIGKLLDPFVDKVNKVFVLVFFWQERLLDIWIIYAISLGEAFVFIMASYAIYLTGKIRYLALKAKGKFLDWADYKSLYRKTKEDVLERWRISFAGKIAVVFYVIMAAVIFLNIEFFRKGGIYLIYSANLAAIYNVMAIGGLLSRGLSIRTYMTNILKWYEDATGGKGGLI